MRKYTSIIENRFDSSTVSTKGCKIRRLRRKGGLGSKKQVWLISKSNLSWSLWRKYGESKLGGITQSYTKYRGVKRPFVINIFKSTGLLVCKLALENGQKSAILKGNQQYLEKESKIQKSTFNIFRPYDSAYLVQISCL